MSNQRSAAARHREVIAAVVPAFNESRRIRDVVQGIPSYVNPIIVVNDASKDDTSAVLRALAAQDPRVVPVDHAVNQGVGGAMITGFKEALERKVDIVVKIDGDGQMPMEFLPALLDPLLQRQADYSKGNRFRDLDALRRMPLLRRVGNLVLSFAAKAVTGYWDCFDPTNGFFAIRSEVLRSLPLGRIDRSYFFEHSMLIYLYLAGARIQDVPMPSRYGDETSKLRISQVLYSFPPKLLSALVRRVVLKNFLYDFTMASLYLLAALPLLLFGTSYGLYSWVYYTSRGIGAPTGTVVVPTLCIILAVQFLLAAIEIDLRSTPKVPLTRNTVRLDEEPAEAAGRRAFPASDATEPTRPVSAV